MHHLFVFCKIMKKPDAAGFGKINYGLDGIPNTVVKVQVPSSTMQAAPCWGKYAIK
jgi:hypothetical protein